MLSTSRPVIQCQNHLFDWAEYMDLKSWSQLKGLFAPKITIDYTSVGRAQLSLVPRATFVQVLSSPGKLGNPGVVTQHLIGTCRCLKLSENKPKDKFQIKAAHLRKSDTDDGNVVDNANAYSINTFEFELKEEGWKIVSITVMARSMEGDFMDIFKSKI
ncbi:Scytalone dehydratase [Penicillium angulare]|uniref:Scytalone dehydratase n=1 Tax=Penicillium angulare TaxID=116970 RepID=UPI002541CF53|nr:Scytalone dehydratase [Penicillium angulare]KAJ5286937.1 Scytalone dehydratase [Penicillium angulare]